MKCPRQPPADRSMAAHCSATPASWEGPVPIVRTSVAKALGSSDVLHIDRGRLHADCPGRGWREVFRDLLYEEFLFRDVPKKFLIESAGVANKGAILCQQRS